MRPQAPRERLEQASRWAELTRWERAEVGRALRRLGWTYGEIMEVIPVPKGTLSGWCQEIRLTPKQIAAIKARVGASRLGVPVDTQRKRRQEIERIERKARQTARSLLHDPLWVAGSVLYWAEGAKSKRTLAMANTDPRYASH